MKILFISRAFPPILGGIENQNYELLQSFKITADVETVINTKGKKFLPLFLPYALIRALIKAPGADVIILGDAVLSPLGYIVQQLTRTPCVSIIHGLDISFSNSLYQLLVNKFALPNLKRCLAVGSSTKQLAIEKGIPESKIVFIPNGVRPNTEVLASQPSFSQNISQPFCLSLGRLIQRKGVTWFIDHVVKDLPNNIHYVIAGDGPEKDTILSKIKNQKNITYLGRVSHEEKLWLYQNCLAFIQPNIPIKNDIEGFGLVVLEATINNAIVIASRLEGLQDAIKNNKNGFLLQTLNAQEYADKITELSKLNAEELKGLRDRFKDYTLENYHWNNIAERYLHEIQKIL